FRDWSYSSDVERSPLRLWSAWMSRIGRESLGDCCSGGTDSLSRRCSSSTRKCGGGSLQNPQWCALFFDRKRGQSDQRDHPGGGPIYWNRCRDCCESHWTRGRSPGWWTG